MSDRFENDLREHLRREWNAIPRVPAPLTARVSTAIRRERRRLVTQFASLGALLVVLVIGVVVAIELRGDLSPPGVGPAAVSSCPPRSGGTPGPPVRLKEIRTSGSRVEIEFEPPSTGAPLGFPAYQLVPQASAQFSAGPGQEPRILSGSSGLRVNLPDAGGGESRWILIYGDVPGPSSLIREVALVGDAGGGAAIGIGLSSPACVTVRELPNPPTLVLNLIADSTAPTHR